MKNSYTQNHPLIIVLRRKVLFIVLTILSVTASALITFLTPKLYQSTAIVYPTDKNTYNSAVNDPKFGYVIQADRLIQLFMSQRNQDSLVKKFNLLKHFELDTTKVGWRRKLDKNLSKMISYKRTQHLSVRIEVNSTDPELSAKIANYTVSNINKIRKDIFQSNMNKALDLNKNLILVQERTVDSLLKLIYSYPIDNDNNNPLDELVITRLKERHKEGTYTPGDEGIEKIIQSSSNPKAIFLIDEFLIAEEELISLRKEHLNIQKQMKSIADVYLVSKATVDDQKVLPSLRFNLLVGLILGIVASLTIIFLGHQWSLLRDQLKHG